MAGIQTVLGKIWLGLLIACILAVPGLRSLRQADLPDSENRRLAPALVAPGSLAAALEFPRKVDQWVSDHFGFRSGLVKLNNRVRFHLFRQFPTNQVIAGQDGRIFLSAHATYQPDYTAIAIPCGATPTPAEKVAGPLAALRRSFAKEGVDARILIAPSSPVIYREDLPPWLGERCRSAASPIDTMLRSAYVDADVRGAIYYPYTEMRALKDRVAVFPKTWFHWAGAGAREVAGLSVNRFWDMAASSGTPLVEHVDLLPSDIGHLFPGVRLSSPVAVADYAKSGVEACTGPPCFPTLATAAAKLGEVAFYRNPKAPEPRLVILSDSYGQFIAGWYSRYFREVIHFSTNYMGQLDAAEAAQFRAYVMRQASGGRLMLLYHDGSTLWGRPQEDWNGLFAKAPLPPEGK